MDDLYKKIEEENKKKRVGITRQFYLKDHDPVEAFVNSVLYLIHCYKDFWRPNIKGQILIEHIDEIVRDIEDFIKEVEIVPKTKE